MTEYSARSPPRYDDGHPLPHHHRDRSYERPSYDPRRSPTRLRSALDRLEPLESYKQFMMHQEDSADPQVYLTRYEAYCAKYQQRLQQAFFSDYKRHEWMMRRYSPTLRAAEETRQDKNKVQTCSAFISDVKENKIKFCLDEEHVVARQEKKAVEGEAEEGEETSPVEIFDNDMVDSQRMLYIRRVPSACPESTLREAIQAGGDFEEIYLSDPVKKSDCDFDRSAWVLYATIEAAQSASSQLQNTLLQDPDMPNPVRLQVSIHRQRAALKTPSSASLPERITFDLKQATALAKALDQTLKNNLETPDEFLGVQALLALDVLESEKQKLDAIIGYLRRVHSFIYYAGEKCIDYGDVLHTRPALFCRPVPTDRDVEDFQSRKENLEEAQQLWNTWFKILDEKVKSFVKSLNEENLDKEKKRKASLLTEVQALEEKALTSVYETYATTVDDTGKQRCGLCKKLFKAAIFAQKHIKNKHPELVQDKMAEVAEEFMWKEYSNDANPPVPTIQSRVTLGGRSHGPSHGRGGRNNGGDRGNQHRSRGGGYHRPGGGHGNAGYRRREAPPPRYAQRRNSSGEYRGGHSPPHRPPQEADPRQLSRSYQDIDHMKDTKVELDFNVLGSLPPPKKKAKTTE